MKTKLVALAGLLVSSLLSSVTVADTVPTPDEDTGQVITPNAEIKSAGQCPSDTVFFKNAFPNLTNGPGSGVTPPTPFNIGGTTVWMTVSWNEDNSFGFDIMGGVAHRVGVTVDTNRFIYEYSPAPLVPVSNDQNLNWYMDPNEVGDDVAHLDLCLSVADPGDIVDPDVTIIAPTVNDVVFGDDVAVITIATDNDSVSSVTASVVGTSVSAVCLPDSMNTNQYNCSLDTTSLGSGNFTILVSATDPAGNTGTATVGVFVDNDAPTVTINEPSQDAEVSGTQTVSATVVDNVAVNPGSVTACVYPDGASSCADPLAEDLGTGTPAGSDTYTWMWDTSPLLAGTYTIEASGEDTSGNTGTDTVTVEVVKSFADCFGTLGDEDFEGNPSEPDTGLAGGCKPTDLVRLQTSQFTQNCAGPNPDYTCFLSGTLLKPHPDNVTAHCGDHGFQDPRMIMIEAPSPMYPAGRWIPNEKRALHVFAELGIDPSLEAGVLAEVQAAYPPGSTAPTSLDDALVLDENTYCANGCCAFAQHVKGYETEVPGVPPSGTQLSVLYPVWPQNALAFIKVHFPLLVLDDEDLIAECYDTISNPDLQNTGGAGYQPLFQNADDSGFVTVLTQKCVNPARTLTRNNGFDASNVIVSTAEPYIDAGASPVAVLNFMYQQNEEDFARLFASLDVIDRDDLVLSGNFRRDVRSPVNQAKKRFDNFNKNSLQQSINALIDAEDGIRTKTTYVVTEANPPGEALSLISHLIWELGLLREELIRLEDLGIL